MGTLPMRRWTRRQYEKIAEAGVFTPEDRVELIDGAIVEVTPQGCEHATAICLLHDALRNALGDRYLIRAQLPFALDLYSAPEPDIAVVEGSARDYRSEHPSSALLLIEVSDASLAYDREMKGRLYARAGIPEYWIVNLLDRCVEVYRCPGTGELALGWIYRDVHRYKMGEAIPLLSVSASTIAVSQIMP